MKIDGNEEISLSALDDLIEGCQVIGFDWKYKYLNKAASKQARTDKKELLGYSFVEKWPGIEKTNLYGFIKDCLENRNSHKIDNKFDFPDGDFGWFELRIQPIPAGAFILSLDITDRIKTQQELQQSNDKWKFATEGAGDGIWDWNTQTNEVFFSKQWKEMLGFKEDEIKNTKEEWEKRVHPDDINNVYNDLQKHFNKETSFYKNEHRLKCKDGNYKWILARGKVLEWTSEGKPFRVIGMHTDISERKKTEKLLKESEERFAKIFNSSPVAISLTYISDLTFAEVNEKWCKMTGYTREEALGKTIVDLHLKNELQNSKQILKLLKNNKVNEIEGSFTSKKGQIIETLTSLDILDIGNEKFVLFLTLDISEKKRSENEIKYQQELLREMGKLAKVGGFEFIPKTGVGKWTDEVARIHDMDPDEYTSRDVGLSFYRGDTKIKIEKAVKDVSEKGIPYDLELEIFTKKTKKWIHSIAYPIYENGEIVKVRGSVQDITDRKIADEQLRTSETLNKNLVKHLPQKIFIKDTHSVYISCNDNYAKGLNLKPEDIIGKTDFDLYPAKYAKAFRKDDKEVIRKGITKDFEEKYFSDGKESFVHTIKIPFRNELNKVIGVLGVFEDITERKIADEKLKRNENLLQLFVKHSPAAIAMFDKNMNYIIASKRFNHDYNLGDQNLIGRSHYEVFPELTQKHKNIHQRCLKGETLKDDEDMLVRANGEIDWIRWEIRPWYENNNKIGGIIFFSEVITDKLKAQIQLKEERDRFVKIAETVPGLICSFQLTPDGKTTMPFGNLRTNDIYGFPPEKLAEDFSIVFDRIHPDDLDRVNTSIAQSAKSMQPWKEEYKYIHPTKGEIWIEGHSMPIREKDGSTIWHGYLSDITNRKNAINELVKSNAFIQSILKQSPHSTWISDNKGTLIEINNACCKLLKVKEEEVIGKYNIFKDKAVIELGFIPDIEDVYKKGIPTRFEIKYDTSKIGHLQLAEYKSIILYVSIYPIKDIYGNITNAVIQHVDITEQKIAEEKLKENLQIFTQAEKVAQIGSWKLDINNLKVTWSDEIYEIFDISPDFEGNVMEKGIDKIHPNDKEKILNEFNKLFASRKPYKLQYRIVLSGGIVKTILNLGEPFKDENGKVISYIGIIQDITERKKTEEKIVKLNEELEGKVAKRTHDLETKINEIERINRLFVGRELRMKELKGIIKELEEKLNK